MINGELIVDNFAGGGGTSVGIQMATGIGPDIAVNHSHEAIRIHMANHPETKHYCEDIWQVNPVAVCSGLAKTHQVCGVASRQQAGGYPVALAWFSPACTHFSRARGRKPKEKAIRGLPWSACRWAAFTRPRVIILENVVEFQSWGPLGRKGRQVRKKRGVTFKKFVSQLQDLGYQVEYQELVAADFGTPTMRRRFFLIARRDGKPIAWPEPTHGPVGSKGVMEGKLQPYVGAYTKINFSIPCPSIFDTSDTILKKYGIRTVRPLVPRTVHRILEGVRKFIINNPAPFFIPCKDNEEGINAAFIVQQQGKSIGTDIRMPLNTITAGGMGHVYLAVAHLQPAGKDEDNADVGYGIYQACMELFTDSMIVQGKLWRITDIGLRILTPKELYGCQGFPKDYEIERDATGKTCPKGEQTKLCGNAVCPPVAAALIQANLPELCQKTGDAKAQPAA